MTWPLALLLAAAAPSAAPLPNLDFADGRLTHWQGEGFAAAPGAVSSRDGQAGRTGTLHRTFVVPPGTGAIRFTAAAIRADGLAPDKALDVILEATGRRLLPRRVNTAKGWRPAPQLLPPHQGRPFEYEWPVADFGGQAVRIALIDQDGRPGCHVECGGFRLVPADEINGKEFAALMLRLEREHKLPPMVRLDSKHFMSVGNATEEYAEHRLYNCETIHALFFEHFRKKGFAVRPPAEKMMVAIFDSQAGFEAYLGRGMSTAVLGIYHTPSNRLVVYDYAQNRAFQERKKRGEQIAREMPTALAKQHVLGTFSRQARDYRADTNIGTMMHEVAHQLSFNGGLLNRQGDVAAWLAEGLACYCEPTANGAWQGIGEPNPRRAAVLARVKGGFIPLRALVGSDDWLRKAKTVDPVVVGYSQSWALFRLLMEERPKALRRYLALVYARRTPDHRLADFAEAFGDLTALEKRYQDYLREVVRQQAKAAR
ncbi:MAG TPA: DUF1570 domain-containing protein [Gemmataceae bacterium]|jgi:hypothetical protein|nr:DUF1570 domain-containing protein [Gemmataceae bacterium]